MEYPFCLFFKKREVEVRVIQIDHFDLLISLMALRNCLEISPRQRRYSILQQHHLFAMATSAIPIIGSALP